MKRENSYISLKQRHIVFINDFLEEIKQLLIQENGQLSKAAELVLAHEIEVVTSYYDVYKDFMKISPYERKGSFMKNYVAFMVGFREGVIYERKRESSVFLRRKQEGYKIFTTDTEEFWPSLNYRKLWY